MHNQSQNMGAKHGLLSQFFNRSEFMRVDPRLQKFPLETNLMTAAFYNSVIGQFGSTSISILSRWPAWKRKHPTPAIMAALSVHSQIGGM